MENSALRNRYARNNINNIHRRRQSKENSSIIEGVVRQIVWVVIILTFIAAIKFINTPVTNKITQNIKSILFTNYEIKNVYKSVDKILEKITGREKKDEDEDVFNEDSVPASSIFDSGNSVSGKTMDEIINEIKGSFTFILPMEGVVESTFGERVHPVKKTKMFHYGIDIDGGEGALIKAAEAGEIVKASSDPTYGNFIRIDHGDGVLTVYAHCSEIRVTKDQKVSKGDIIARVGNTGLSIGTHLHFEIWKDNKPLNPLEFIKVN